MNPLDIFSKSKCFSCANRLSRVVEPVTQEDKEHYMEMLDIDDLDDYEFLIEQHRCLITDEDLDGIIHECNQYVLESQFKLIREYEF